MKKFIYVCILLFLITLIFYLQATYFNKKKLDEYIPFLFFVQTDDTNLNAKLGNWIYFDEKIKIHGKTLFTISKEELSMNKIYKETNSNWFGQLDNSSIFIGKNVYVEEITSENDYEILTSKSTVSFNIHLSFPEYIHKKELLYLSTVDYNEKSDCLTFVFLESTGNKIYVAQFPCKAPENVTWKGIRLEEDMGISPVYSRDSVLVNDWLYGTSGYNGPIRINITNGQVQLLDKIEEIKHDLIKPENNTSDGPNYIVPCGSYNNVVIWKYLSYNDDKVEQLVCLFDEQSFLGALHIDSSDEWHIIGQDNSVTIDMSDRCLYKDGKINYLLFPIS